MEKISATKKRVLTGDRPTGPLHLGHYVGSLVNRLALQSTSEQYIMIADVQALTDNFRTPQRISQHVLEVFKDYLSVGIDPEQSTVFIQSQIPALTELTIYFLNLVTLARLERNPTVKHEITQKAFGSSIPAGFLCYPVSQAADISLFLADEVPVGEDQLPILEQSNEIVRRFNHVYQTDYFKECTPVLSQIPRLLGIDGRSKASKSLNNAIFLSDSAAVVREKVFQMYTDPQHIHVADPGRVEGNVVFLYLDAFYPNKEEVEAWKEHYRKGGLGDSFLKKVLSDCLNTFLEPIRARREAINDADAYELLRVGTSRARAMSEQSIARIREIMGIHYSALGLVKT